MRRFPVLYSLLLICALVGASGAFAEFPPETFPPETDTEDSGRPYDDDIPYEEQESQAAEDEYLRPRKRRDPAPPPRTAPASPVKEREEVVKQRLEEEDSEVPNGNRRLRLYAMTGLSRLSSDNGASESLIDQIGLKDHFALALAADFQFSRFLGAEFEGFYASTPSQEVVFPSNVVETRQLIEYSLLLGVRGEYAISKPPFLWRPRIGTGIGLTNVSQISTNNSGSGDQVIRSSGFYLSAGVEVDLGPDFWVMADYLISLFASGQFTSSGIGGAANEPLQSPAFSRLRLAVIYKWPQLMQGFGVGGMLVARSAIGNVVPNNNLVVGQGDRMLQFLLLASLTL